MASDQVWVCETCQVFYTTAALTERHWAEAHQKRVRAEPWGETVIVGELDAAKMLEEFLPAYKQKVEREFAETICQLLDLMADAKDEQTRTAEGMPAVTRLNAAAETLRDLKDTVRVMAELPVET